MTESLRESRRYCAKVAGREAGNFYASFLLLPAERRRGMCALYAFFRRCDDIADEPGEKIVKKTALEDLRNELAEALAGGRPIGWRGWPALVETIERTGLPARYLREVMDGVEMDLEPRRYADFQELSVYCRRVASAVGLCCLHVWGFRSEGGLAESLAEDCGLALQLTNIIRDVGEDARAGRVYLPSEDLDRFGVAADDLLGERVGEPLRELLAFEAARARGFYERAAELFPYVEPVGRPVLGAIVGVYRGLLDEIERRGFDVLSRRISLSSRRKATIALGAFCFDRWFWKRHRGAGAAKAPGLS